MSPAALSSTIDLHAPKAFPSASRPSRTYIIYFITGNPGLIEYYRTFLTHLYALLAASDLASHSDFRVYGRSLSGFEVDGATSTRTKDGPPYGLETQILHSKMALENLVHKERENGAGDVRVVLIGHSVGAYMLLEIIRQTREALLKAPDNGVRIAGGVGLFPTITHLAQSRSGIKFGVSCPSR